jgi:membrane-associated phospholipid phosphatase
MTEPASPANAPLPAPEKQPRPPVLMEFLGFISLGVAVLSVFLFAWLAEEMRENDVASFDSSIRAWVHSFASPRLTDAMTIISLFGYNILIVGVISSIAIFLWLRWRRAAAFMAITMLGAGILDATLKSAFHRVRPQVFFGIAPTNYSFPSGHALASCCFYSVLAGLIAHRVKSMPIRIAVGVLAALMVAAIGISRIYLGMHYPSDVIAGYLAAAVWVSAMLSLDSYRVRRRKRRAPSTPA